METTKTTLYLEDSLRERLKVLAAQRGKTLTALLAEGAELVIARYRNAADRADLEQRAARARRRLRAGLYAGPPISDSVDTVVYARIPRNRPRRS